MAWNNEDAALEVNFEIKRDFLWVMGWEHRIRH
jgi:hypothetical protein